MNRAVVWLVIFWFLFLGGAFGIAYFTGVPHPYDAAIE